MMEEHDNALAIAKLEGDLRGEIRALEERMETKQAEYRTDIARLAEQAASRHTQLILAIAGMLALAVAVLGFLIGLPTE
ncbi:MAG: hypothetical protein OXE94_10370 [Aestuariivita sp.]|nr:hypothetical protein [Aestuariivita sp.]MCY4203521.1 hypothetical protein [Aestuariivita sp.]MCY4288103.1 hypothetical protein [Aestuariivita sp.]MCY4346329.1 hypothetical protein [Aestuariivita sp.]